MSEQTNNIIRFNYSVDPTTLMSNSWITTNTDTTQNTVTGVGGSYWRTITFDFTGKNPFSGVFRIKVDENGIPDTSVFESISGDEVVQVHYGSDILQFNGSNAGAGGICTNFSTATENTTYTETTIAGTWSYVQSDYVITHYWRTITFDFTGKGTFVGVFRIEVDNTGVPIEPYNFESISGDEVTDVNYGDGDRLALIGTNGGGELSNFSTAVEGQTYTETAQEPNGTWSYVASTTTETIYDHYEVELYVKPDITTFPKNLFYADNNITYIEFDTYSITSIEDGDKNTGAFLHCVNLVSIILPNNIEYIGNFAVSETGISQITLPSTLEEIGSDGLNGVFSITSLAIVPPTIYPGSISLNTTLTIHETALQSYINSDWADYVTSISTIETPTYNNVLKFNYSEDPTEMLKNLWVNSCTDTSANTVVGVGEHTEEVTVTHYWRTVTFDFTGKAPFGGVFKIEVDEDGVPVEPYNFESLSGDEVKDVQYTYNTDSLVFQGGNAGAECNNFSTATENTTYTEQELAGTWSYVASTTTTTETVTTYDHYEVTLYINSALNTFETTMFADDENITSVEFDYNVTSIIDDAFNGCENLSSVTLTSTVPPTIGEDTFSLISPDAVLRVPNDSINLYLGSPVWSSAFNVISPIKPSPVRGYGFNLTKMVDVDYKDERRDLANYIIR